MPGGDQQEKPISLFYSYSHRDEELRKQLEHHLAPLRWSGLISEWHDRNIDAGEEWAKEIDESLSTADIILLLVSASFIASEYCWSVEMKKALERHDKGEATVIPVILRPCRWTATPFANLQAAPTDAKPVTSWSDQDEALSDVAHKIQRAITTLQQRRRPQMLEARKRQTTEEEKQDAPQGLTRKVAPRVFISYSHDTIDHQERVLDLADRLRTDGIDAEIDQYNASPPEGWPLWCEREIDGADFVLMVCTETYRRRVSGDEVHGLGLVWEARIIHQLLYDAFAIGDKFVPVLFSDASPEEIPLPIRGFSRYVVDTAEGYEGLYRRLTRQPPPSRPALRTIRTRRREWVESPRGITPPPETGKERVVERRKIDTCGTWRGRQNLFSTETHQR